MGGGGYRTPAHPPGRYVLGHNPTSLILQVGGHNLRPRIIFVGNYWNTLRWKYLYYLHYTTQTVSRNDGARNGSRPLMAINMSSTLLNITEFVSWIFSLFRFFRKF